MQEYIERGYIEEIKTKMRRQTVGQDDKRKRPSDFFITLNLLNRYKRNSQAKSTTQIPKAFFGGEKSLYHNL